MKKPSPYLKMRVLGAIDVAEGNTRGKRVKNVAALTFTDEEGNPRQFTWRTIQTWLYRYKNHGITGITNQARLDKGKPRKVSPEELMEAGKSQLKCDGLRNANKSEVQALKHENSRLKEVLGEQALDIHILKKSLNV